MMIDQLAMTCTRRAICPHTPGHEPKSQYEAGAVRQLHAHLLAFWREACSVEIEQS